MDKGFLPDGYKVPKSGGGNYTKLVEGANKLRILCVPIMGWEYWTEARKPVRSRTEFKFIPPDADVSKGWKPKHFWAFVVWNYNTKALEILEITQATIQNALTDLVNSEDWGDPLEYDLTITRKGTDLDTEYSVMPGKQVPVNPIVKSDFEKKGINLEALFDGANPFEAADGPVAETGPQATQQTPGEEEDGSGAGF